MTWDEYFLRMASQVAEKSKDRSTKVGAVVVGPDQEIRATGYNGFPRGLDDSVSARYERPLKYKFTEHAERNALYYAARVGVSLKGCTLYLNWMPCIDCARGIIQAGIQEVVCGSEHRKFDDAFSFVESIAMLKEAGVEVRFVS